MFPQPPDMLQQALSFAARTVPPAGLPQQRVNAASFIPPKKQKKDPAKPDPAQAGQTGQDPNRTTLNYPNMPGGQQGQGQQSTSLRDAIVDHLKGLFGIGQ